VNLAQLLAQTAAKYADKPAIIFEDKVWTYRVFYAQVQHYASILDRLNIKKGDRVAIYLPMIPEAAIPTSNQVCSDVNISISHPPQ
jgi:acyl-coenzyme A synthetase/AMP-(fatty) acid ligase